MSTAPTVAVIVGSLRKGSYSRALATALAGLAAPGLNLRIVEIGDLPHYNPDLDEAPPAAWTRFRAEVKSADAVLFVTPEYNRSVPGVLKNAIDVGSRPYGSSVWDGKPGAVVSQSPGALGGFGSNHHLRQSLVFLNVPTLQQPEAYISGTASLFDDQGKVAKEDTAKFLKTFLGAFQGWVERHVRAPAEPA
ncbi:MAG: NAD(P)H-dependent oxidoreductase [Phenylobacterium sp.]|uniref:NADPH-dependent FMN reductase n=1 Tax=Phenylobacterium sp. TaxID=1871053 RepID=UPI002734CEC8|nr:NAD(P)H-dependent oxidoreductase [Phenylobacterium sp.]MDP3175215.1 NAD(P)H-dependent oxidoreductase [Phenylobacterium sp.]